MPNMNRHKRTQTLCRIVNLSLVTIFVLNMGALLSCTKKSTAISNMTPLTPEQISIIQRTWNIPAANPLDSGEAILIAYFEKYPKNQEKFNAFQNVPLLSLKVCAQSISLIYTILNLFILKNTSNT